MVSHLVCDYVGLGKVSRGAEARQFPEKVEIDVDLAIARAIKRPGCRRSEAARCRRRTIVEDHLRRLVSCAGTPKQRRPCVFCISQNRRDELGLFVGRGCTGRCPRLLTGRWRPAAPAQHAEQLDRVSSEKYHRHQKQNAHAAPQLDAAWRTRTARLTSAVFYILTTPSFLPAH